MARSSDEYVVKYGRVVVEQPLARILDYGDQSLKGGIRAAQRPLVDGTLCENNPSYPEAGLAFLPGCGTTPSTSFCDIRIVPDKGPALSFRPPSLAGEQSFVVEFSPDTQLPQNRQVKWIQLSVNDFTGTVAVAESRDDRITLRARHPNKARIGVQVEVKGRIICSGQLTLSVPQFFHVVFSSEFDRDLEMLGLRRVAPSNGPSLSIAQVQSNERVKAVVIQEALETAKRNFREINVRFTLDDPADAVGPENVSTVVVGGPFPADPPPGVKDPFGISPFDPQNKDANDQIFVFSGEFADRSHKLTNDRDYLDIFDQLATRDQGTGALLPGKPVDENEFVDGPPEPAFAVRTNYVRAAAFAFGRFIGTVISHECGHALGLNHNKVDVPNIMNGSSLRFQDWTGIRNFDPSTGDVSLTSSAEFRVRDQRRLWEVLPILP